MNVSSIVREKAENSVHGPQLTPAETCYVAYVICWFIHTHTHTHTHTHMVAKH